MIWALIPIVAILSWAYTEAAKHRARGGGSAELERMVEALGYQLDEAEAERKRLTQRIENLEAIVTSESFELDRAAQAALPASPTPLADTLEEELASDEDEVARRLTTVPGIGPVTRRVARLRQR